MRRSLSGFGRRLAFGSIAPFVQAEITSGLGDITAGMATPTLGRRVGGKRSEEHTSELQSLRHLVCRLLLEKKKRIDVTHLIFSLFSSSPLIYHSYHTA